jgi:hypothetical protein
MPTSDGRSNDGVRVLEEALSWTTETLSMSARRELLKKELRRLGFDKPQARPSTGQQQQQQEQQQPAEGRSRRGGASDASADDNPRPSGHHESTRRSREP